MLDAMLDAMLARGAEMRKWARHRQAVQETGAGGAVRLE